MNVGDICSKSFLLRRDDLQPDADDDDEDDDEECWPDEAAAPVVMADLASRARLELEDADDDLKNLLWFSMLT